MCFAPQRRALFRHLNLQKWSDHGVFCTFWLGNVLCATTACSVSTSQLPKVVRTPGVFCTFWLGNVLCATTACSVSTSQLPKVVRTPGVFCTFWLGNVLRATTAFTFSTSQLSKVVRPWCVLYIFTSKCASRHNGVHFFDISTSKSGPTMVCFVHFDLEMSSAHLRATTACNFSSLVWPAGSAPATTTTTTTTTTITTTTSRRKFRSQTSDNMDRWKAEQGRGREKRKIRRKKIRRERVSRKKMQMREKVGGRKED